MGRICWIVVISYFVFGGINIGLAQTQKKCATMEIHYQKMQEDPVYRYNMQELERLLQNPTTKSKQPPWTLVDIPVVFHIVHTGTAVGVGPNISDALVMAQFDQLYDDFRRLNSDTNNTPVGFINDAADTEIGFCLAAEDPNGNATTGINRVNLNTLSGVDINDCWSPSYISGNVVTPLNWNRDNYLNIYCVPRIDDEYTGPCYGNSLLGFAQFPGGAAATDAVVNTYFSFGSISTPNPITTPYNLGRTVTHEVGHWFGLNHIWGDDCGGGSTCSGTDYVTDTPNQRCATYGCPNGIQTDNCTNTSPGIMYMNYMDYSNDACLNLFTNGQAGRMQSMINSLRPSLLNSTACGAACPTNLNVNMNLIPSGVYEASNSVTSNKTVPALNTVEFYAGDCIELQNNFYVNPNSNFTADIQDCD